jgi:hypothetical protein
MNEFGGVKLKKLSAMLQNWMSNVDYSYPTQENSHNVIVRKSLDFGLIGTEVGRLWGGVLTLRIESYNLT